MSWTDDNSEAGRTVADEGTPAANGQRRMRRSQLLLKGELMVLANGQAADVLIRNLSTGGMMVEGQPQLVVGEAVEARLPGLGRVRGVVAWTEAGRAGISFSGPVDPSRARTPVEPAPQPPFRVQTVKRSRRPPVGRIED